MATESITKLDAARRQLDLAILLHFRDDDPLGVHTLAGAAHRILGDLLRLTGQEPHIGHKQADVKRASHPELVRRINEARNFAKHADSDHDQVLTFNPDWTGYLIYDAIWMFIILSKTLRPGHGMFLVWIAIKYPDLRHLDGVDGIKEDLDNLKKAFPELNAHKEVFLKHL